MPPRDRQGGSIDVSAVITTRDRWPRLASSLRSALAQSGVSLEVIVVDDASETPPSADVRPALDDERVKLVRLPGEHGPAAAANVGVRDARGAWVALLNDCDLWAPHHLATLLEVSSRDDAEYGYCAAWLVDEQWRIRGFHPAPAPDAVASALLEANVIARSSVIFRNELWHRGGGFDEWLTVLADWDLWLRWSRLGRAGMVPTASVATAGDDGDEPSKRAAAARELRELKRRYARDAKREGVRFGQRASSSAPTEGEAPPHGVRPPWLADESFLRAV